MSTPGLTPQPLKAMKATTTTSPFAISASDLRLGVGILVIGLMSLANYEGWTKIDSTTFMTIAGLFGLGQAVQMAKIAAIAHVTVGTQTSPLDDLFGTPTTTTTTAPDQSVTTVTAPTIAPQSFAPAPTPILTPDPDPHFRDIISSDPSSTIGFASFRGEHSAISTIRKM